MKSFFLALALVSATALLAKQQASQSPNPQAGSSPTDAPLSQQTIQGCLQRADNSFTLIDSSGTTYQLEGDASKLREHVGHEIQLTGTIGQSAASSSSSPPKDSSPSTIQFVDVKHLASSCKAGK